jgi:hypothetical protein
MSSLLDFVELLLAYNRAEMEAFFEKKVCDIIWGASYSINHKLF